MVKTIFRARCIVALAQERISHCGERTSNSGSRMIAVLFPERKSKMAGLKEIWNVYMVVVPDRSGLLPTA